MFDTRETAKASASCVGDVTGNLLTLAESLHSDIK